MKIPRVCLVLFGGLWAFVVASAADVPSAARIKSVPVDPALARLAEEELIDRLQQEQQHEVIDSPQSRHTSQPALAFGFLPVDSPRPGAEHATPQPTSQVMTELVRRGVAALPALIRHLADTRPTGLTVRGPDFGIIGFDDQYDARDPERPPAGVNTVSFMNDFSGNRLTARTTYTIKVGELCYDAIGKIVNRGLFAVSGRAGHVSAINSPIRFPQLARAVETNWAGLTPEQHEQSLRADLLQRDELGRPGHHSWNAVRKLMFYYPGAGREALTRLLQRSLVDQDVSRSLSENQVSYQEQAQLVAELAPVQWDGLDAIIYDIYLVAAQPRLGGTIREGFYRDLLAFACARRLVGRGHDAEFKAFFSTRLTENDLASAKPENRFMVNSLTGANRNYVALLKVLANPPAPAR